MPKAFTDWTVLDHGPIEELADNLWRVEGAVPRMSLRRNMVIARQGDGRLVIHNGMALGDQAMQRIESWGTPAFLLVPNAFHRLDAPAYKKRYPDLRVLTPAGARQAVEQVVAVDGSYDDFPLDPAVRLETLEGLRGREGAMIVRSADGVTIVLNDVVMNMDRKRDLLGFLFTTLLGSAPGPRVSRLSRMALVGDRKAFRAQLEALAATPELTRLVVAHEKVAHGPEAAAALRQAATFL